ncbi:hypothetical protein niasHS_009024 [Heterodera schachtii]|uniref:B30.2/SPRY domain-containing protein n=1 Tax=Heterodera schachtii TaxID=97005 RepID=A0ABD2J4L3_HETSC
MAKRKANVPEELRILKTRIAELECMQQTNNSEAFEQSGNAEVNDDGGQTEENQGPIEVDQRHQQKQFREKISGMEVEMSNTQQLCMITQFENKLLQSKLKHYELMKEQNELQAKVVEMEDQQKKKKKQGRKEDEQGKNEQIKAIFDRIDDLEKQQQIFTNRCDNFAGKENPLAKIQRMDNFIALLKDRFGNELLKAVHPNDRQNIVENFLHLPTKNCWDANACHNQLRIMDDKSLTVSWWGEEEGVVSVFAKHPFPSTCSSSGIFYYETKILMMKGYVSMPLDDCVGHHWDSYGYESGGNFRTSGSVWLNEDRYEYSRGDIIGCGVNLASRRIIFTHNGRRLDTSDLFLSPSSVGPWFPCISLSEDTRIVANFGPYFKFDPTKIAFSNSIEKNCWDATTCDSGLEITDKQCLTVHYKEERICWLTVFAKLSILVPNYADFFYFEIKVKNMKEAVLFGFATKQKHGELRGHVRNGPGIFSYESDGTFWASGSVEPNAKFATGSVVGCGINLNNRQLIFTKNGKRIDDDDYRVPSSVGPLFPFVTLFAVGEKIEANFGPKFHFNFDNI